VKAYIFNMKKPREGLLKNAFFPIWTRVPGTPFSLPGNMDPEERLPGMDTWAPRERMERISAGMHAGVPIDVMMRAEGESDQARNVLTSAGAGLLGGGLLGRAVGGEAATAPLRDIIREGGHNFMKNLAAVPTSMKALAGAGALGGAYYGANRWAERKPIREHQAYETARAMRNEQMLNDVKLMQSNDYLQDKAQQQPSVLNIHPHKTKSPTASEPIPHVVSSGEV
jgi:hypothetical protein